MWNKTKYFIKCGKSKGKKQPNKKTEIKQRIYQNISVWHLNYMWQCNEYFF